MRGRSVLVVAMLAAGLAVSFQAMALPAVAGSTGPVPIISAVPVTGGPAAAGDFTCNGENLVGTIYGRYLTPGAAYRAAFLRGSAVEARDSLARRADANGNYVSATLTVPYQWGPTNTVEITDAATGTVIASATFAPACTPAPTATGSGTRSCPSQIVTGSVAIKWLMPPDSYWTLVYAPPGHAYVLASGPEAYPGRVTTFPFTTDVLPHDATTVTLTVLSQARSAAVPVTVTINSCSVASTSTSTGAVRTSAGTVSTSPSRSAVAVAPTTHSSTTRPASTTPAGTGSASSTPSGDTPSSGAQAQLAATSHNTHSSSSWTVFLIIAIIVGVAILGLAGGFIYRAQRAEHR